MDTILKTLEWLSKYGIIDLVFGIGIFTFIAKFLKRKTMSEIENVDLVPYIDKNESTFTLTVKNQSNEPLYLYKAYLIPGYPSEQIDKSTFKSTIKTLLFISWKTDKFPKVHRQPKTSKGEYILQIENLNNDQAPTLFIERYRNGSYVLHLDQLELNEMENPNDLFDNKEFGLLRLHFVQGTRAGILEVQL